MCYNKDLVSHVCAVRLYFILHNDTQKMQLVRVLLSCMVFLLKLQALHLYYLYGETWLGHIKAQMR